MGFCHTIQLDGTPGSVWVVGAALHGDGLGDRPRAPHVVRVASVHGSRVLVNDIVDALILVPKDVDPA